MIYRVLNLFFELIQSLKLYFRYKISFFGQHSLYGLHRVDSKKTPILTRARTNGHLLPLLYVLVLSIEWNLNLPCWLYTVAYSSVDKSRLPIAITDPATLSDLSRRPFDVEIPLCGPMWTTWWDLTRAWRPGYQLTDHDLEQDRVGSVHPGSMCELTKGILQQNENSIQ